jgi:hypothetical protein
VGKGIKQITIIDVTGRIFNTPHLGGAGAIDISKLTKGIYFITIETNNSYVTQKFIKN